MSYSRKMEYKIVPEESYVVIHNCGGCGSKARFVNTGRFRVNANGNKLDIWLIYQCEKCKHTLNLPIYERTDRKKVPPEEYGLFLQNDETLAEIYGMHYDFFSRNRMEVDWKCMAYRIENVSDGKQEIKCMEHQSGDVIVIHNPHGVKVRSEKIVGQILEVSRSVVQKLLDTKKIMVEQNGTDLEIKIC